MKKLFFIGVVASLIAFSSCDNVDLDGTKEAAEAGRHYALKEWEWSKTSPNDPDYNRLSRELELLRKEDYDKYCKDSKKTCEAYEKARMEKNRELYK